MVPSERGSSLANTCLGLRFTVVDVDRFVRFRSVVFPGPISDSGFCIIVGLDVGDFVGEVHRTVAMRSHIFSDGASGSGFEC